MGRTILKQSIASMGAITALGVAGVVQAGGFQITELSARQQGSRNAGAAAIAEGASTVYFNPAGLTYLKKRRLEVGAHVIIPKFKFHDKNSTNAIGGTVSGKRNDDAGVLAAVPNLYFATEVNDRISAGVGINVPYGLTTDYSSDWVGRYHAIKSDLLTFNVNLAVAGKINDMVSVGAGVSGQYAEAELTSAVDFGTIGFLLGVPGVTPSTPQFDGKTKLTGNDFDFGYNLGVLVEPRPGTRLGVSYRSAIKHDLKGRVKTSRPDFLGGGSETTNAKARLELPATVWLGAYHEIDEDWAIMAGATWTDWSTFEDLRVRVEDGSESVQPENWHDSWRVSIGGLYRIKPKWIVRAGFEYDESPVDAEDRTPRVPDADRYWFTVGTSYEYSESFTFDFAYTYIHISDYSIDDTEVTTGAATGVPVGNTLDGRYEANANILSAQVRWTF